MNILTLFAIAAVILLVVFFVIRRVVSSNFGTGSRSQFNIENSDVAKENKRHQDQSRKNFEESRNRNENMRKQLEETNKRYRTMWG